MSEVTNMIAMICVDDKNGMMFNRRRQSQDRIVREHILQRAGGSMIWMNAYSQKQFANTEPSRLKICEDFLDRAGAGDFCFVEGQDLRPYIDRIEEIILYKWNRSYPADVWFEVELSVWKLAEAEEFVGSSHEKITMERYIRCEN